MSVDMIGDFLTVIRNGLMVSKRSVQVQYSRMRSDIARVLKEEGFILDYEKVEAEGNKTYLKVFLKYVHGEPVIHEITRVSKPGRRYYERCKNIEPVIGGMGISIISTSAGLITDKRAQRESLGGEVICRVW